MGGISSKNHPAFNKTVHAQAGEGIDAGPFKGEVNVFAQQRLDARNDIFGFLLFFRVGIPSELKVDAPDVIGLAVQQHALVGMERRVKPEPAFGGEISRHFHVGNQEVVAEDTTLAF